MRQLKPIAAVVQRREVYPEMAKTSLEYFDNCNMPRTMIRHIDLSELNKESTLEFIKAVKPDVVITYGCGIIKEPMLSEIQPAINIHLGIGKKYIGRNPVGRAYANNDKLHVGATIHKLSDKVDEGTPLVTVRPLVENLNHYEATCVTLIAAVSGLINYLNENYSN